MTGTATAERREALRRALHGAFDRLLEIHGVERPRRATLVAVAEVQRSRRRVDSLTVQQLIVVFTQAGWTVSELAARLGVPRGVLHVVMATGSAPVGLVDALREIAGEPVPNVCGRSLTAAESAEQHRSSRWPAPVLGVTPELLEQVWGRRPRSRRGWLHWRAPAGWTRMEGHVVAALGRTTKGGSAVWPVIVCVSRRVPGGGSVGGLPVQDLGLQQFIRWPARPRLVGLPTMTLGIKPYGVDGEA